MIWSPPERAGEGPILVAEGIVATTPIATPDGWCCAGDLSVGMQVVTFDGGIQRLIHALKLPLESAPPDFWPLRVPCGALDNRAEVMLLPDQKLLIEADCAEDLFGDPFALIPARALEGWRGIERFRPPPHLVTVQLQFARHQLVYASRGLLLSCPGDALSEDMAAPQDFSACSLTQARHLVLCLMAEEAGAALRKAEQRRSGFPA